MNRKLPVVRFKENHNVRSRTRIEARNRPALYGVRLQLQAVRTG